jgi:hypothetical protein
MLANVIIWEIDRKNQTNMKPVYLDVHGTYSNTVVDDAMIKALVTHFAYPRFAITAVSRFNIGMSNVTWAFASDGAQGTELYLARVVEL